jgi:hypothetical protein
MGESSGGPTEAPPPEPDTGGDPGAGSILTLTVRGRRIHSPTSRSSASLKGLGTRSPMTLLLRPYPITGRAGAVSANSPTPPCYTATRGPSRGWMVGQCQWPDVAVLTGLGAFYSRFRDLTRKAVARHSKVLRPTAPLAPHSVNTGAGGAPADGISGAFCLNCGDRSPSIPRLLFHQVLHVRQPRRKRRAEARYCTSARSARLVSGGRPGPEPRSINPTTARTVKRAGAILAPRPTSRDRQEAFPTRPRRRAYLSGANEPASATTPVPQRHPAACRGSS